MSARLALRSLAIPFALALALLTALFAQAAQAQATASAYTYATRYDLERRVVGTIAPDPDGTGALKYLATRNTYNAQGWLTKVEKGELANWMPETTAPSAWTGFTIFQTIDSTYDVAGRKIKETVSSGATTYLVTQYSHDSLDRVTCTTVRMNPAAFNSLPASACTLGTTGSFGADRITQTVYDAAGRVSQIKKAVGTPREQVYAGYSYTDSGQVAFMYDANGTLNSYTYDALDRRARWYFPSKTTANTASTDDYEEYGYDAAGNRISMRKRDGRVFTYTYDNLNRMTSKVVPDACVNGYACTNVPASATRDVFYAYDNRGLTLSARFDSQSGEGITNVYDNLGRLTSTSNNMAGTTRTLSYQYDADSNRTRVTHPDGNYALYQYDGMDRSTNTRENGTTATAAKTYDSQGRLSGIGGGIGWYPGYDFISRVARIDMALSTNATSLTTMFTYNPANQIVTRHRNLDDYTFPQDVNVGLSYVSNGLNQYTQVNANAQGYDANGNLTSDGTGLFLLYDAENRLVGASGTRTVNLLWDPLGRLFETSGGTSGTTRFLYDGDALVAEYDGSGTLLRRYVHGSGVDEPLVWYEGSGYSAANRRHIRGDIQGSIIAVSDSTSPTGVRIGINSYDDWGRPASTNLGRFGYTGQIWLPDLGMWHYKARIYSPMLGRFLQVDPIGYEDQANLYAYVGNEPVLGRDPTGQETITYDRYGNATIVVMVEIRDPTGSYPVSVPQIAAAAGTQLRGSDGATTLTVKVVEGQGGKIITVNPALNPSSPNGADRPHTDKIGGNNIQVAPSSGTGTINHEIGHSMGAGDQYKGGVDVNGNVLQSDAPGSSESSLMRSTGGSLNAQSVREILNAPTNSVRPVPSDMRCQPNRSC